MIGRQSVAHVSTVHHPSDPRISMREVPSLRRASIETWLIARDARDRIEDPHFLSLTDGKGLLDRLRRHVQAYRHLRKLRPAVVHIHDPELIPVAFLVRHNSGCKVVYDMHEDYAGRKRLGGRVLRLLENWCFRWVDHVVLAEASYEEILKGTSTPSTSILNYILPPEQEIVRVDDTPLTLMYSGTISNSRGLRHMLDLASAIKEARLPWRIRIVGVCHLPEERRQAERRIRDERLDCVEIIGWDAFVPWSSIVEQYARADIGLALFEPLPNHTGSILSKFYEYIYLGLPVVCSNFPLWRAFFESNGCGMVIDPADPARVLALIKGLAEGDGLERLGSATRISRDRYVWSLMEPRLIGLYEDLLSGGPSSR